MSTLVADIPRAEVVRPELSGKTILYVVNDASFLLSHRLNIARAAKRSGARVIIAAPPGTGEDRLSSYGFEYTSIELSRWGMNPLKDLQSIVGLARLYRRLRPDLLHHVTIKPVLYGSLAARIVRSPSVVNSVSGLGFVFVSRGFKAAVRRVLVVGLYRAAFGMRGLRVIVQNRDDLSMFEKIVPRERLVLVPGAGVDCAALLPTPEPEGPPVVVLPARLLRDKGVREFVAAAELLRSEGIQARFLLAGDLPVGNPAAISEAELERWKQEGVAECLGFQKDIPALLAQSHIVCLPSYREGLPKALLEASAAGKPMITTDVPGCREVVRDGENGFLVPARDVESLAQKLRILILDGERRQELGARARELLFERGMDEQSIVRATLEAYAQLLVPSTAPRRLRASAPVSAQTAGERRIGGER